MKGKFIVFESATLAKSSILGSEKIHIPFEDYPDLIPGDTVAIPVKPYGIAGNTPNTTSDVTIVRRRYNKDSDLWDIFCHANTVSLRGIMLSFE